MRYLGAQIVYNGHTLCSQRAQWVRECDALQAIPSIASLLLQPETPGALVYVQFSGHITKSIEMDANLTPHGAHDLAIVTASGHRVLLTDAGHLDLLRCNCDFATTNTTFEHDGTATTTGHRTVETAIAENALVSGVWLLESVPRCGATGDPTLAWAMVALNHPALVGSRRALYYGDHATQLQRGDSLQSFGTLAMLTGLVFVGGGLCHLWSRR
ncbi:hypothetical protein SPRG_16461 [Saprolegnia parasitica CBS 223.65]|uniref:Uncharacterized protein n=1 Tax=Saprolegnia parasitica (strain CBS 223.65) TaxID=695850 RepID=A0A067BV33_SAPPC|nr:hypothetical protein SPRG_16461 [Saprolegnia parasitica CBS 223.65]KDO18136.1 hypothetical protein SPRG_16461 [Saprolegnia parasitica CBS 223.65]|eukprot:XP_012211151.1 hypothetical protein SPRG_16461 [Saprolegnia parasitica CBS 223.65]